MLGIVGLCVPNMIDLEWMMHAQCVQLTLLASQQSHMANCILFEKESDFCMAFVSATGQPTWESAHELYLILQHLDWTFILE